MRKFTFLLGLVVMTTSLSFAQSNYQLEEDGTYTYTGTPVAELSVDFTTWLTSDLPSTLTDNMTAAEKGGMAFVKWKIASRPCGDKGTVNALFNNNANDFGGSPDNGATTNPPRIYLPTTAAGVTTISLYGGYTNQYVKVYYKDDNHSVWTQASSIPTQSEYGDRSISLNSVGQTAIYLEYTGTGWLAITNLDLDIEPFYEYNSVTNEYDYLGKPVDAISVDFSTWAAADLPDALTDDMPLSKAHGLGFVKWKLAWYNQNLVNQRVLFNNNTGDAGVTIANNTTSNPPAIYFPTTVRGIESIAIRYVCGNTQTWLKYRYTDDLGHKEQSVQLPASLDTDPQTYVLNLNTHGQTSINFLYQMTVWMRVLSIEFTIKSSELPQVGLWDYTTSYGNMDKLISHNGQNCDVHLNRSFIADGGYYTLCLPFDLTAEQVTSAFGACTLAKLSSSEMRGSLIHLTFDYVNSIEAGVPYLFLPSADIANCVFSGVTIDTDASREINTTYFKMTGIYNPTSLSDGDFYMGEDNYLLPVTSDEPLRPFRSYFSVVKPMPTGVRARVMFAPEHTTGFENVQGANVPCTKELRDGHLYIRRGETVYTISGQIVK